MQKSRIAMPKSYSISDFVANYLRGRLDPDYLQALAGLRDFDDFFPGLDVRRRAAGLSRSKGRVERAVMAAKRRPEPLPEDTANCMVLAAARVLQEAGEGRPFMLSGSHASLARCGEGEYRTSSVLSSRGIGMSDGMGLWAVKDVLSLNGMDPSAVQALFTEWYVDASSNGYGKRILVARHAAACRDAASC